MAVFRPALFALLLALVLALPACKQDTAGASSTIEITFPEDGSLQRDARLRVKGTAENVERVEIDGVDAEVVGGEWEALVPVDQGEVTLTATGSGASDSVTFTVDSVAPAINVATPERAQYRDAAGGDTITVSGNVYDDGSGLEIIKVGEQIIHPDDAGNWSWDVTLHPGLNEITTTARDVAGNESNDIRGVMFGEFVPPDQTIEPGFDIWLGQSSLPVMEQVVEGFVTPENLLVMASAFESDLVKITSIKCDPVDATIGFRPGAIDVSLLVTNLEILGKFTISGTDYDIRVAATRLRISTAVTPYATADGKLDITFSDPVLELSADDLSYDIADLSDTDNQYLEQLVIDSARAGFGYVLSLGLFQAIWDDDLLTRKIELLGKEVVFQVAFEDVDIFSDGMLVRTSLTMPVDKWPEVRDSPGALNRAPGPSSGYSPDGDVAFSLTQSTLDRLMHGVWHSGMMHYQLDSAAFAGFDLPVELTAGSLATFLDPAIANVAPANTPAALRLRPMFPPVAEFDIENKRLLIQVGEFWVDLMLLPPGKEPVVLATISAFLDLSVRLSITEGIVVHVDFDTDLRADVADEPVVDLDDERTESLLSDVIGLIPDVLAAGLDLRGEADVTWLTLGNPRVWVHGVNNDYATVNLTMTANPQTLEPPQPQQP